MFAFNVQYCPPLALKVDFHTHPFEAMRTVPSRESVKRIAETCLHKGLQGVAVTEHLDANYGWQASLLAQAWYPYIIVIPGVEVEIAGQHVLELYFPQGVFRIWAHPDRPTAFPVPIHGIEVENHVHPLNRELAERMAVEKMYISFRVSDAHSLDRIGEKYTVIDLNWMRRKIVVG
jgi:hypothetical protein